jgi:phytoene dehydrogenase-like protein
VALDPHNSPFIWLLVLAHKLPCCFCSIVQLHRLDPSLAPPGKHIIHAFTPDWIDAWQVRFACLEVWSTLVKP